MLTSAQVRQRRCYMADNRYAKYALPNRYAKYAKPEPAALPASAFFTNMPSNAYDAGAGLVNAIRHPLDTASGLSNLANGAIANIPGVTAVNDWAVAHGLSPAYDKAKEAENQHLASTIGQNLNDSFRTPTRAWNTIATHPVDTLMMAAPGLGMAGKAAELGGMAKAGSALAKVSEYSNPVNMVGKTGAKFMPAQTVRPPVLSENVLQADKTAKYGAVKRSGMSYKPEATKGLVDNIYRAMARDEFDAVSHPQAAAKIKRLEEFRGSSPSLTDLDKLRRNIRRDVIAPDPGSADAHFGQLMINKIDKFSENTSPKMMTNSAMAQDPGKLLNDARKANVAFRKTEMVNDKLDRGERAAAKSGKGANTDNALRQKIDEIINEKKGKTFRTFSSDEQSQMENTIVRGTKGRNFARGVGAMAPSGIVSGYMSGGAGAGIGTKVAMMLGLPPEVGAVVGGATSLTAGQIGKMIADRGTRSAVDDLMRIIQNGGKKLPKAAPRTVNDKNIIRALIAGRAGGASTATQP